MVLHGNVEEREESQVRVGVLVEGDTKADVAQRYAGGSHSPTGCLK